MLDGSVYSLWSQNVKEYVNKIVTMADTLIAQKKIIFVVEKPKDVVLFFFGGI